MSGPDAREAGRQVTVGRVSGVFGVRGWVKVYSYTDPPENVLSYREWWLWREASGSRLQVREGRLQGRAIIVRLEGIEDRERAAEWVGATVAVEREALPPPEPGCYYWADLLGLEVRDLRGRGIGRIERLLETGAHDVLVVSAPTGDEILIPFVVGEIVHRVCPQEGYVEVDWEWS